MISEKREKKGAWGKRKEKREREEKGEEKNSREGDGRKRKKRKEGILNAVLRLLTECFILVGCAMFDATFNLVTRVGLP